MNTAASILVFALLAQPPAPRDDPAARAAGHARNKYLLEVYTAEAAGYTIYRDASRKETLELRREPVYIWSNQVRDGSYGAVYVWTSRGRAEVIGTVFSLPTDGPSARGPNRDLCHELHSLSVSVLDVSRSPRANRWTPRAPGVELTPIPGAPPPAPSAAQRLAQMRTLAREFSATTRDMNDRQWDLRLLPQPLYRYESTDPDVLDGALFAFVTSAGTDPEVILAIEARKPSGGGEPTWRYAVARFTDLDLRSRHKGTVVFTADRIPLGGIDQDGQYRYHVFKDRASRRLPRTNPERVYEKPSIAPEGGGRT
jgi:hypothetical protein